MELFSEYRARKAEMLSEAPFINAEDTPAVITDSSIGIHNFISKHHDLATPIGNNLHHLKHTSGSDIYYHLVNDKPKELSVISKNTQVGVDKGIDGDSKHIHNIMRHHLDTHGELKSSNSNTIGSKRLWTNFIKNNKDVKFNIHNSASHSNYPVDHTNIDKRSPKIWGTDKSFNNITIIATK